MESATWYDPAIAEALQENGISSITDLNDYAVNLEQYASSLENDARNAFEFLVNSSDPNEVLEFVAELQRQARGEEADPPQETAPQQQPPAEYQRPAMPAPLPAGGQLNGQSFYGMTPGEVMALHGAIGSPEQIARWDEAIMNTPQAYFQELAPYLIQGS
jgi:hypothetical protein